MKIFITILIAVIFSGCSIKSKSYYILEGGKQIVQVHPDNGTIGIEKIELPRYFEQNNLAIKKGANKIIFLDKAHWVSDMDEQLTSVLIAYLKRYFNTTKIFYYPWEAKKNLSKIVSIRIENFIFQDDKVVLEVSWEIKTGSKSIAKFFKTQVPSDANADNIVKAMNKAFGELQLQIARSLRSTK